MVHKMKGFRTMVYALAFLELSTILVQAQQESSDIVCSTKETCGACIQELGCSWCPTSDVTAARCLSEASQILSGCPRAQIISPQTTFEILQDESLRAAPKHKDEQEAVQIRPQRLRTTLRVGEEIRFKVQYQQAQDYPVDLYYLMDLSASMEDDKDKLSRLAWRLAQVMNNITDNFRLGFGSFVDKTAHPFINTSPEKINRPCTLQSGKPCAPPYSFRHHLSLTQEHDLFAQEVRAAPVSGNLDTPEGGLDALVQVMVCSDRIGWRRKARKLVVFATDSGFHMAGDGKLGGVVLRNDLQCHMDARGLYTHALEQDYPSVAQINTLAKEHNVNIIFAVAGKTAEIYNSLKDAVHGAAYGLLDKDSSNVVDLVKAEYNKIVDSVTLSDNSDEYISIKYYSLCNRTSSSQSDQTSNSANEAEPEIRETRECGGLRGRQLVEFEVALTAVRCPPSGGGLKRIHIKPGAVDESVLMEVEVICECNCERPGAPGYVDSSSECSSAGTSRCGVCACESGRYGRHCECDATGSQNGGGLLNDENDTSGCRPDNTTEVLCSNHGVCKCNKCTCHTRRDPKEHHYGSFCQCDNFSCPRSGGAPCGGASHGTCDCGRCQCLAGWQGDACDCPAGNEACVDPDTGLVCSGRGECVCGRCSCSAVPPGPHGESHKYSGRYCTECSSCPSLRCDELRHCVECKAYGTGKYTKRECEEKCTEFTPEILDSITPETYLNQEDSSDDDDFRLGDQSNPRKFCRVPDQSGCIIVFDYRFVSAATSENQRRDTETMLKVSGLNSRKKLEVRAQKDKECGEPVDMLAVILGVVGSILLAGLVMLLIWKLLTTMHDKREYARFEKERAEAKWSKNENPLYKPSTTTFHNPTFGRKSVQLK